jgi:hypothetical protein
MKGCTPLLHPAPFNRIQFECICSPNREKNTRYDFPYSRSNEKVNSTTHLKCFIKIKLFQKFQFLHQLVKQFFWCQCTSCNGPEFDPSIRRHSGIWGAAVEAVLNKVRKTFFWLQWAAPRRVWPPCTGPASPAAPQSSPSCAGPRTSS